MGNSKNVHSASRWNTYNFTFLAGRPLEFSSLVLFANHSHMCKCWVSNPKRENEECRKCKVSKTAIKAVKKTRCRGLLTVLCVLFFGCLCFQEDLFLIWVIKHMNSHPISNWNILVKLHDDKYNSSKSTSLPSSSSSTSSSSSQGWLWPKPELLKDLYSP